MDTLNLVLVLLAAFVNLVTAYLVLQLRAVVVDAASNILKVEKATNSMKDALVAATAKASLAEGRAEGREMAETKERERPQVPMIEAPLPVADDRTAQAAEQTAHAAERSAAATERVADAAEEKKGTKK